MKNLNNVDPFEHIRQMQLNKIRINNFTKWDVAKYDEFIADGLTDYNTNGAFLRKMKKNLSIKKQKNGGDMNTKMMDNQEQVINEEVRISDFAFSKFQELREIDGIDDQMIQESLSPVANNDAVFKAGES